ncbi:MAG: hypothetical protein GYB65_02785 [Chloroflexi bacterium]|nr:hypothetical protein [Chloroflexota bacterium]
MKRGLVLIIVLVLALALVPTTSADPNNYFSFQDVSVNCASETIDFTIDYRVEAGASARLTFTLDSASQGTFTDVVEDQVVETVVDTLTFFGVPVVPDGTVTATVEVFNPDLSLASVSTLTATCPEGTTNVLYGDGTPGGLPPDPAARATATCAVTVPLYYAPDLNAEIPGLQLEAGQTWFVVGTTLDTDGNLWYEVYVGGPNNAYAPGYALYVSEQVPVDWEYQ